jgi:hypothetical protein
VTAPNSHGKCRRGQTLARLVTQAQVTSLQGQDAALTSKVSSLQIEDAALASEVSEARR